MNGPSWLQLLCWFNWLMSSFSSLFHFLPKGKWYMAAWASKEYPQYPVSTIPSIPEWQREVEERDQNTSKKECYRQWVSRSSRNPNVFLAMDLPCSKIGHSFSLHLRKGLSPQCRPTKSFVLVSVSTIQIPTQLTYIRKVRIYLYEQNGKCGHWIPALSLTSSTILGKALNILISVLFIHLLIHSFIQLIITEILLCVHGLH